jgi:hypothetical protein
METLARAGEFSPPRLLTLKRALEFGIRRQRGRVFADLWNLELFAHCAVCRPSVRRRLEEMNFTQWNWASEPSQPCIQCGETLLSPNGGEMYHERDLS